MKILITGMTGFIGDNLRRYLVEKGNKVIGITTNPARANKSYDKMIYCDLSNRKIIDNTIKIVRPDIVIHLGGQASVGRSWNDIQGTINGNIINSINLLDVCIDNRVKAFIYASSGEIYAKSGKSHNEIDRLEGNNPYALSKLTVDQYCNLLINKGNIDTKIIVVRQFPTIGVGQRTSFVIASWADQINKMSQSGILRVGNIKVTRDFLDIRDTVDAYYKLISLNESGTYNICSNKGIKLQAMINKMIKISGKEIYAEIDKDRLRPVDIPILIGNNKKIYNKTFWKPLYSIDETLETLINKRR